MRNQLLALLACMSAVACGRPPVNPGEQVELTRMKADELHARATSLQGNPRKSVKAAELHRKSARLRPPSDPRAYDCYATAGQILVAAGRLEEARTMMIEAADFALERADTMAAARAYVEAVVIAARQKLPRITRVLNQRLRLLGRGVLAGDPEMKSLLERATHATHEEGL